MVKKIALIILIILALITCFPIIFIVVGSFMNDTELAQRLGAAIGTKDGFVIWNLLPMYPTLRHYIGLLLDSPKFFVMFWNSLKMTMGILIGQLIIGVPAAWGFARYNYKPLRILFTLYILLMMLPFQLTMLSNYIVLDNLNLLDTQLGIILPLVFSTFPVFIMYRFFKQVPEAVIESAKLDGAGHFGVFIRIGIPLGSAGIISAMVLGFLEYWNLIEQPMTFLKTKSLWPLSLYLPQITLEQAGMALAASVITLVPSILVFMGGQDYLEKGIMASAVKE